MNVEPSRRPVSAILEHHEIYTDRPDRPHVIIAEAPKGPPQPERLKALRTVLRRDFLMHMAD